jgi:hypothetical protein
MLMGVFVMFQAYVFPWMIVVPPAVAPCPAQLTKTDGFFHRAKLKNIHA